MLTFSFDENGRLEFIDTSDAPMPADVSWRGRFGVTVDWPPESAWRKAS